MVLTPAALAMAGFLVLTGCVAQQVPGADESSRGTGDPELLRLIRPSFPDGTRVAAAVIDDGDVRRAYLDAGASTVFETGSITKVFTGELLAVAIERGEVRAGDELGKHLDLDDAPVASVTLRDLAAHQAGLPLFPTDPELVERATADIEAGGDGIDASLDELLTQARDVELEPVHGSAYSNLGAALLGQALAAAAGTDYGSLVAERLFEPLDLDGASVPLEDEDVSIQHAGGTDADGKPVEPSSLGAYAPGGGIDATIDDLVAFAAGVIDGPLADSAAQTDTVDDGHGGSIGYFWNVADDHGDVILSHNGMTGGFASMLLIDRAAGTAAIVLSNRAESVDAVGEALLASLR